MNDELTGEALERRRARVAESNRRFGRVLSVIGAVLAALAFVLLVAGGLVLTGLASNPAGTDDGAVDDIRGFATIGMSALPGILLLLAMCGLIVGEQLRRGSMRRNPAPPDTVLPQATMVSGFSVLSDGWHLIWIVVGLLVSLLLVGLPVLSWFTGGWPSSVGDQNAFAQYWLIYGAIAFGITVAALVSLIKKRAFRRAQAGGRIRPGVVAGGQRFWRWFDYRWRFDLWLAGLGGLIAALSTTALSEAVGPGSAPGALAAALPLFIGFLALGLLLVAAGVVCALNFWRSGEALGTGESAA
ncbi:hypothetical protein [Leifsonia poae]|uniref:hypothetical protein n=1 Tax=Leifsonia poae TaxID=110933 RepID=UPI001CBE3300|nr:hypothetical protein [Leifsonia poae]